MDRKLQRICRDLLPPEEQGKVEGILENSKNSGKRWGLSEAIRGPEIECQVSLRNTIISSTFDTCTRLQYGKVSTTRAVSSS